MIPTHELIDPDDPRCLYCGRSCDIELKGEWISHSQNRYDVEVLSCRKCKEKFEIHSVQTIDGETALNTFVFTCKELCVVHVYAGKTFEIGGHGLLYDTLNNQLVTNADEPTTKVPAFEVDFSDKNKLSEKLRTYLLFS